MSPVNLFRPDVQTRLHQQRRVGPHHARHDAVPVDRRGAPRTARQHHPVGLRERVRRRWRRRPVDGGGDDGRDGSAVPGVRRHQGAIASKKSHRKHKRQLRGGIAGKSYYHMT